MIAGTAEGRYEMLAAAPAGELEVLADRILAEAHATGTPVTVLHGPEVGLGALRLPGPGTAGSDVVIGHVAFTTCEVRLGGHRGAVAQVDLHPRRRGVRQLEVPRDERTQLEADRLGEVAWRGRGARVDGGGGNHQVSGVVVALIRDVSPEHRQPGQPIRGQVRVGDEDVDGVEVRAICDLVPAKVAAMQTLVEEAGHRRPAGYSGGADDYRRMCDTEELDLIFTATP